MVDEVSFNIMMDELTTKLNEKTHINILKKLKEKPELFDEITSKLEIFKLFLEKAKGIEFLSCDRILNLRIFDIISTERLLPRDSLHLGIMKVNGINYIATLDEDFLKIGEIIVIRPDL